MFVPEGAKQSQEEVIGEEREDRIISQEGGIVRCGPPPENSFKTKPVLSAAEGCGGKFERKKGDQIKKAKQRGKGKLIIWSHGDGDK